MAIDTHVHLDAAVFASDLPAVLQRAAEAGIDRQLTIGTDLASSRRALELATRYATVWSSAGYHPHEAAHCPADLEAPLLALAANERVVAIGETGLDFYRNLAPPEAQRRVFRRQIDVAQRCGLPLIIHSRDAHEEVVQTLADAGAEDVVLHCFSGDRALAQRCLEHGWFLAFGGAVTYPRNGALRDALASVPDDRLLLETDAPYLAPVPYRGQRNEPAWLRATLACCADIRRTTPEALAARVDQNAMVAFPRLASACVEEA